MIPLLVNADVERLFFENYWSYNQLGENGTHNPDNYEFDFKFIGGAYLSYCSNTQLDEKGYYTTSADSIYITLTESTVPERIGITLSTQWRRDFINLVLSNAPSLTNTYYTNDEIVLFLLTTSVSSSKQSWGEIKLQFKE